MLLARIVLYHVTMPTLMLNVLVSCCHHVDHRVLDCVFTPPTIQLFLSSLRLHHLLHLLIILLAFNDSLIQLPSVVWTNFFAELRIGFMHFYPRMRFRKLMDRLTTVVIALETTEDEVFAFGREEFWHLVVRRHNLLVQVRCFGVLKGQVSCYHCVENDATRPNISLEAVVTFASNHLN